MIKIACYSDLHGRIAPVVDCDLALIAGDLCPDGSWIQQLAFLQGSFTEWLGHFKKAIFIAGNHDHFLAQNPHLRPTFKWNYQYLEDNEFEVSHPMSGWMWPQKPRISVYGLPWSLRYGRYDYMCEEHEMPEKLKPARGCNIIISHGPPYRCGDIGSRPGEHTGSRSLLEFIDAQEPRLVVCGHIHESRGVYQRGNTTIVNAASTEFAHDEYGRFRLVVRKPFVLEFDDDLRLTGVSE